LQSNKVKKSKESENHFSSSHISDTNEGKALWGHDSDVTWIYLNPQSRFASRDRFREILPSAPPRFYVSQWLAAAIPVLKTEEGMKNYCYCAELNVILHGCRKKNEIPWPTLNFILRRHITQKIRFCECGEGRGGGGGKSAGKYLLSSSAKSSLPLIPCEKKESERQTHKKQQRPGWSGKGDKVTKTFFRSFAFHRLREWIHHTHPWYIQ
jgi:hypothetical protein